MNAPAPEVAATIDGLARLCRTAALTRGARMAFLGVRDREHGFVLIEDVAEQIGAPACHVTPAGIRTLDPASGAWSPPGGGMLSPGQMVEAARSRGGIIVLEQFLCIVQDAGTQVAARVQLAELLARQNAGEHGCVLICLEAPEAERHIPELLAGQVVRFRIGYPQVDELQAIARDEIVRFAHAAAAAPPPVETIRADAGTLGERLVGLTRKAARDLLRDSLVDNREDIAAACRFLEERKTERLRRELSMEVLDAGDDADLPLGVDGLLEFLEIQKPRMRIHGSERARGVLLVGPPGVGKTMIARAAGRLTGLPVCVMRVGGLMNSLLGETERLFSQAFSVLESMSPNIVMLDEIEKAFSDSSERDGGTMMRVTGSLLSWLGDNRQPNFVIATCNGIDRMGETGKTMTRSGRFDEIFFIDVPTEAARAAIWARCLGAELAALAERLAAATPMFSGADIQAVAKLARARADCHGRPPALADLELEIARKRPRAAALHSEFDHLRHWAASHAVPAGRLSH